MYFISSFEFLELNCSWINPMLENRKQKKKIQIKFCVLSLIVLRWDMISSITLGDTYTFKLIYYLAMRSSGVSWGILNKCKLLLDWSIFFFFISLLLRIHTFRFLQWLLRCEFFFSSDENYIEREKRMDVIRFFFR